jgi:hypothetical protein
MQIARGIVFLPFKNKSIKAMKTIITTGIFAVLMITAACGSGDTGEGYTDTMNANAATMPEDSVTSAVGDGDTTQQRANMPDNTSNGADTQGNPLRQ